MHSLSYLLFVVVSGLANPNHTLHIPFEKYVLPNNGLEVILSENHSLPLVAVNIWYHAGPINEKSGRTGFAHLFEHLMFQGSQHVGDDMHIKLLSSHGASFFNGTTSFDRTNYLETVPANALPLVLWLESDRMGYLLQALTQTKLDNQRDVVMNERRQSIENRPYGLSGEKLIQTLFDPNHPYYGVVMGSMADLAAANLQDVEDFYSHYYAPANATLAIVGDFNVTDTKALIEHYFGTLQKREKPTVQPVVTPQLTAERRTQVHESVTLPQLSMAWLSPAAYQPGDADADVLANILGYGTSSRLYQRLVYELQLAQDVEVEQMSLALTSVFSLSITARSGVDIAKLELETQKVLDNIRQHPPEPHEIERARNTIVTQFVTSLQKSGGFGGRAEILNRYNQYIHDPGFLAADIQRYEEITPQSVQALANNLLDPAKRAVVITVPQP